MPPQGKPGAHGFGLTAHTTWWASRKRAKDGCTSGIDFGPIDYVKYAEAFGAKGLMIRMSEEIVP